MELAGLKVVMDADFSAVYAGFKQAEEAAKRFQQNTANIFKSVTINPDALAGAGKATEAVVKAQKEASAAIQETNVQWRNQAGTINNAISQNERYKAELAQVRRELKLTSAGQKDMEGNLRSVSSEVVNLRLREAQLKQAISENNISVRSQAKEMLAAHGSMVQLSQELGQMRTLYRQLSAEERNSPFGRQLVTQIKQADAEIKRLDASIGNHQRNVGNYASAFNPLNHNIAQITREFPAFANSMQTGFMAVSNNIPLAVDSMRQFIAEQKQLQAQGKPSKTALQGLAGAIFSWNTALSAAITLSVVYGPKLVEMAKNGWKNVDAIKAQKEYQEALTNAVDTANGEAATQIARIRVLNDTMTNANLTMKQRKDAYKEAIKEYPSYLKKIKEEDALSGGLADTINNKLIPAILAAAKARAYEQKIQLAQERIIDLEQEQIKNLKTRAQEQNKLAQAQVKAASVAELRAVSEQRSATALEAAERANERASNAVDLQRASVEQATKALNDNAASRIKLNEEIDNYAKGAQRALEAAGDLSKADKATAGAAEKATTALQDLINKNRIADQELGAGLISKADAIEKKIQNYQEYVRKLVTGKHKISIEDSRITEARDEVAKLSRELAEVTLNVLPSVKSVREAVTESLKAASMTSSGNIGVAEIDISARVGKENLEAAKSDYKEALSQADRFYGQLEKQAEAAFMGLGETIGNAFNGQNFDIVSGIIGMLGDQLKTLGQYLIEIGITKESIEAALKALGLPSGGAAVIVAGTAAVALGQVLQNAARKRMSNLGGRREFAAGGVVYGPTNALVGEYRGASSNPEVIAPLDKLTNILRSEGLGSGNMQPIVLTTRIDGQDLLLTQERAKKWRDR